MNFSRQLSGALAWAGLVIVIAVPTVELVRSKLMPDAATVADIAPPGPQASPSTGQVATAASPPGPAVIKSTPATVVAPPLARKATPQVPATETTGVAAATNAAEPLPSAASRGAVAEASTSAPQVIAKTDVPADPVGSYLAAKKALPSYITPDRPAAKATEAAIPPAAEKLATTLATAAPSADALANPSQPVTGATPASADVPATARTAMVSAVPPTTPEPAPVPMPASARPRVPQPATVTEADLKDWKSGTLEDYLRQHNLLSGAAEGQNGGN